MKFKILAVLFLSVFLTSCSNVPPKPVLNGEGPLKIDIDNKVITSPEFHNPLEPWKEWHMFYVNNGLYTERSCMSCHNPAKSCNNCHSYVGVIAVKVDAPDKTFEQGYNRLERTTNTKK